MKKNSHLVMKLQEQQRVKGSRGQPKPQKSARGVRKKPAKSSSSPSFESSSKPILSHLAPSDDGSVRDSREQPKTMAEEVLQRLATFDQKQATPPLKGKGRHRPQRRLITAADVMRTHRDLRREKNTSLPRKDARRQEERKAHQEALLTNPAGIRKLFIWGYKHLTGAEKSSDQEGPHRQRLKDFKDAMDAVVRGVRARLIQSEDQGELTRFLIECRPLIEQQPSPLALRTGGKWLCSLQLRDACKEREEKEVLTRLPHFLKNDAAFYLRQRWIAELIAHWHREGEEKNISHVFFGTRTNKPGIRSYATTVKYSSRDEQIFDAVEKLLEKPGFTKNGAYKYIEQHAKQLGIITPTSLTWYNVRRICLKYEKGDDPFALLFQPSRAESDR